MATAQEKLLQAHERLDSDLAELPDATDEQLATVIGQTPMLKRSSLLKAKIARPNVPFKIIPIKDTPGRFAIVYGESERGRIRPGSIFLNRLNFRELNEAHLGDVEDGQKRRDDGSYQSYGGSPCVHEYLATSRGKAGFSKQEGDEFLQTLSTTDRCHVVLSRYDSLGVKFNPEVLYDEHPHLRARDDDIAQAEAACVGANLKMVVAWGDGSHGSTRGLLPLLFRSSGSQAAPRSIEVPHPQALGMQPALRVPVPVLEETDKALAAMAEVLGRTINPADLNSVMKYAQGDMTKEEMEEQDRMKEKNRFQAGGLAPDHYSTEGAVMVEAAAGGVTGRASMVAAGKLTQEQAQRFNNADFMLASVQDQHALREKGQVSQETFDKGRMKRAATVGTSGRAELVSTGDLSVKENSRFKLADYMMADNKRRKEAGHMSDLSAKEAAKKRKLEIRRLSCKERYQAVTDGEITSKEYEEVMESMGGIYDESIKHGHVYLFDNKYQAYFKTNTFLHRDYTDVLDALNNNKWSTKHLKLGSNYPTMESAERALKRVQELLDLQDPPPNVQELIIEVYKSEKAMKKARIP